jgi:two-component system, sensor histidine kinase
MVFFDSLCCGSPHSVLPNQPGWRSAGGCRARKLENNVSGSNGAQDATPALSSLSPVSPGDILIVDDKPANLAAIEAILGEFPSHSVRALSGAEALRHLLGQDFALILLDVQMPEMDGFETARLIRQRQRSRHTPIIFLTAFPSDDRDILRAYEIGAVDFMFKPIVPDVLRAKVGVLLELQRRTREIARQAELLREHERREHERTLAEERRRWEAEALRRQMEEERRATIELAKRAAELTRTVTDLERAERELTRMNKQLAKLDRRKDEFLAVLAHELRNPLAPVVAGIDLLRRELPSLQPEQAPARALDSMQRQVAHLKRLVDDLLDVSRINSGKIELRKQPVAVAQVVEQAIAAARPAIDARQHVLEVDLSAAPAAIDADGVRLTQVISNLLHNAARYTPPGGTIRVSVEQDGEHVIVRVADSGQGIAPDALERVFDMFMQQTRGGEGLGVGLALVKRLVELHGGTVGVKSDGLGCGSEFHVRLPGASASAVAPTQGPTAPEARPMRIVVVDDNDDIRELVAELLATHGHSVSRAGTGRAALELIEKLRPQAAIVDLGLPDVDGWSVARSVRQTLQDLPIFLVAMSGYGSDADRKRTTEAGFDAHIVKPAHIDEILRALSQVGQASEASPEIREGAPQPESQHP